MAGQLDVYNKEIFNFLRTVTIKFEHFAWLQGSDLMDKNGLNSPDFVDNPYYQHLIGNYAPGDTVMTVTTVEDGTEVEFNRELINKYPQTAALYRVPNPEYFSLQERYPQNVGLIQSIVYPVKDIDTAIKAPNFSLLAYDDSLLEINEREDLIKCLKEFLNLVKCRWWIDAFIYEDLYPIVLWTMMWQHLPLLLLTRRFNNIKTPYVHSYHVWEYLQSRGLGDYRDVLSKKQSLWLYRNIDYIHANRGKNSTLKILAENLLPEVAVSLLYYDMYQETETRWDTELSTNPVFRAYNLTTDEFVKEEPFSELNRKLVDLNLEHRNDAEFIDQQESRLARHGHNVLDTKFLEFKKEPIDTRTERIMVNFLLDTLFYGLANKKVAFECQFRDSVTLADYKLSLQDTILLWHYACWKSQGITPATIPTKAVVWLPFKFTYPGDRIVNKIIYSNGGKFQQSSLLDLPRLFKAIPWSETVYTKSQDFAKHAINQLAAYVAIKEEAEQSNRKEYHDGLMEYLRDVTYAGPVELNLTTAKNFGIWCKNESVAPLIEAYEEYTDPEDMAYRYGALAKTCFDAIFPPTSINEGDFVATPQGMETIYKTIRDLFIRLGSYNVFYLETERERNEYIYFFDPDFYIPEKMDMIFSNIFDWTHEAFDCHLDYRVTCPKENIGFDIVPEVIIPTVQYHDQIGWDAGITDIKLILNPSFSFPVSHEITNMEFHWTYNNLIPDIGDQQSVKLKVLNYATDSE